MTRYIENYKITKLNDQKTVYQIEDVYMVIVLLICQ
jgi:hypothetical protein